MSALRIRILGKVQGVFFRSTSKEQADALGITGWVRNTDDGNVEMHAEGSEQAINQLVEWCKKGPPAARVDQVDITNVPEEGFTSFEVRK